MKDDTSGTILIKEHEDVEHPINVLHKKLNEQEKRIAVIEMQMLRFLGRVDPDAYKGVEPNSEPKTPALENPAEAYRETLDDYSLLWFGKYNNKRMIEIPLSYFLYLWNNGVSKQVGTSLHKYIAEKLPEWKSINPNFEWDEV